jgi:hypothetical protein
MFSISMIENMFLKHNHPVRKGVALVTTVDDDRRRSFG